MHILIIEDDILLALGLQQLVEDLGATSSQIAYSEPAAILQAKLMRPNLIIADLHLAEGLGVSAIQAIRASSGNNIPAVYVTGNPDEARRLDPTALVLSKPLREEELIAAIRRLRPLVTEE